MTGFDFSRPLQARARRATPWKTILGACLAIGVSSAPWLDVVGHRIMSAHQLETYRGLSADFRRDAVLESRDQTCFGQQMRGQAGIEGIKASTVMIAVVDTEPGGEYKLSWHGTGFVVADSTQDGGFNRIVTAGHAVTQTQNSQRKPGVSRALLPSQSILVFASNGVVIGRASVAALGRDAVADFSVADNPDWVHVGAGDVAVLHIEHFVEGAQDVYQMIPGLDLAAVSGHGWLQGQSQRDTPGISSGQSGSPVVDASTGQVLGVLTNSQSNRPSDVYDTGDLVAMIASTDLGLKVAPHRLVMQDGFMTETLPDSVLGVLGPQGRRVLDMQAHGYVLQADETPVLVPGMPSNACVITHGQVGQVLAFGTMQPLEGKESVTAQAMATNQH